jgi:CubicO group peptidase (beta-lactamase class C family)
MTRTTWLFSETPQHEVALPYQNPNAHTLAFPSYPFYSCSSLITTIENLALFMMAYIQGGSYQGYQLFKPQTVNMIVQQQVHGTFGGTGLIFHRQEFSNFITWGHHGRNPGVAAEMFFDPSKKVVFGV